jgi:ABC-type metal ion transport system, periplasmic component/surface antigen
MKKITSIIILGLVAVIGLIGCGNSKNKVEVQSESKVITYGKAAGPYTILFEDAIIPILEKDGYSFKAVEFSDLLQNNTALNEGEIDVNVEQHTAYMENFNKSQNGKLIALTPIPTVPAAIYSSVHDNLDNITDGARIALPNDASNASRAYAALQKAGWIKLDDSVNIALVTDSDIVENPYNLDLIEMDSSNIPRSLEEFDYAIIPGSIAYSSGIDLASGLLYEDILEHLLLQVVIHEDNKDSEWAKAIADAYNFDEFKKYMEKNNDGSWYLHYDN